MAPICYHLNLIDEKNEGREIKQLIQVHSEARITEAKILI